MPNVRSAVRNGGSAEWNVRSAEANGDFDAVAELIIELIVCGGHVGSGEISAKLLAYSVELVPGNLRVEAQEGCFQNVRQYALFFACASRAVGQFFLHLRIWVTAEDIIIERSSTKLL